MRNVCLLGATGSIGTQTLDIIRLTDDLCLKAFSFGENIDRAIDIINEFKPNFVCCKKEEDYKKLAKMYEDITFYYGEDGLNSLAQLNIENVIFLNALVGSCGLLPTYYAIKAKKDIYLANKETLVIGGDIIMEEAGKVIKNEFPEYNLEFAIPDETNRRHGQAVAAASLPMA